MWYPWCFFCISRPHSTDSATHRKMTLSLADRCSKTQKIRILPMAGRDPESHRNEMIKVMHSHTLSICAVLFVFPQPCLRMLLLPQGPKKKNGRMRPVADKHHARLHKDITWRAYIMRSHNGQWNGNTVSKSGGGRGGLCINCQPKQILLIAKFIVSVPDEDVQRWAAVIVELRNTTLIPICSKIQTL